MKKALYVGSFDPITNGHLWVVNESAKLFDEITVAIAQNAEKSAMFSVEKRKYFVEEALLPNHHNVRVEIMPNVFHIDYAHEIGAKYIVRGIRNPIDLEQETQILRFNERRNPSILPIFLMPPKELSDLSSTLVKNVLQVNDWDTEIAKMVPLRVVEEVCKLKAKPFFTTTSQGPEWSAIKQKGIIEDFVDRFNAYYDVDLDYRYLENLMQDKYKTNYGRTYHNIDHLKKCFKWLHVIKCLENLEVYVYPPLTITERKHEDITDLILIAAILFHDIVYDVHAPSGANENASGAKAYEFFEKFDKDFALHVQQIIWATNYSLLNDHDFEEPYLAEIIRDIDLAELATDYEQFEKDTLNILVEYMRLGDYTHAEVIQGRIDFLKSFNKRNIYSILGPEMEKKAHWNIKESLRNMDRISESLKKMPK